MVLYMVYIYMVSYMTGVYLIITIITGLFSDGFMNATEKITPLHNKHGRTYPERSIPPWFTTHVPSGVSMASWEIPELNGGFQGNIVYSRFSIAVFGDRRVTVGITICPRYSSGKPA